MAFLASLNEVLFTMVVHAIISLPAARRIWWGTRAAIRRNKNSPPVTQPPKSSRPYYPAIHHPWGEIVAGETESDYSSGTNFLKNQFAVGLVRQNDDVKGLT